jgi:serine protease Do
MKRIAVALIVLLGLAAAFLSPRWSRQVLADQTAEEQAALKQAHDLSLAFQRATRLVAPSVVFVASTQREPASRPDIFDLLPRPRQPDERVVRGQGSGLIVRSDGYIMTNNHVVQDATEIRVMLANGRQEDAELVGGDEETDLAVIKIDAEGLPAASFGDSDAIEVGQWVLAVGNPFGLDNTVTAGIVSAKSRPNMGLAYYGNLIQTDAAVNPGNSGGPLVNLYGEVIGINNAITTQTGVSMGIGFAIPANMARSVMESIVETGEVVRGWLGVTMQLLSPERAEELGYEGEGVEITSVNDDGPASRAGLKVGDIISGIDGTQIRSSALLQNTIARSRPGTVIRLGIVREGRRFNQPVTLGRRPPLELLAGRLHSDELGVVVQNLTADIADEIGAQAGRGVLIISVDEEGFADRVGIGRGDIILGLNEREIGDVSELRRALDDFDPEGPLQIRIQRGRRTFSLIVE